MELDLSDVMLAQLLKTNQRYQMFQEGEGIVVGVSGGPDSLALLHALISLRPCLQLRLVAVHVHHGLRGEAADADAAFVQQFCLNHEVPFYLFEADIGAMAISEGTSFEMEGRRFRYESFEQVAQEEGCSKIAVAQNLNDQCETVLMRLFRGAGLKGLGGILPVRDGRIIRPLIEVSRVVIEAYCDRWGLEPRQDHTNAETDYERNRIRLEVIPYLEANFNPGLAETLVRTASLLRDEEACLERVAQEAYEAVRVPEVRVFDGAHGISLTGFSKFEPALKRRLIRCLAREVSGGVLTDFNYSHTEAVLELASDLEGSKALSLGSLEAQRVYNTLWMVEAGHMADVNVSADWEIQVEEISRAQWDARRGDSDGIAVDLDRVEGQLFIRHRAPGDRFKPFGMQESKKLKRFMIDEKIPEAQRHKIPLICDENRIIWVYGYRMSEEVRVGPATERIGWLTLRRQEQTVF
ncbi:tRNA lysidine(34) synthetase TilS [Acidaminobacter hydrogenoformans]|uniref:tRNA(Ile)-lysidine synthase n=1 Tax=Acidaminobacter hydrogenoformans DSM 2784 TaxID=1120920 RepID=A0A1G5RQ72_9FIRM|nr:tRNA lysidine(34) synthetase TilS [Acidaminobacter hydrogenoformans]SCZ76000.1 tRNA(Ile)-lysidine synthase [Acidaminobacter hydrogenoformans DSM 2784]